MAESAYNIAPRLNSGSPILESEDTNSILKVARKYDNSNIKWKVHPLDGGMLNPSTKDVEHYFRNSRSAMELILKAMILGGKSDVQNILDMPSGYGRVARHLAAAFPSAHLTACDINADAAQFCSDAFSAVPIVSSNDLSSVTFDRRFDLIWSGSLFSHLPEDKFREGFRLFSRSLAPGGIAVVTTHGRYSASIGSGAYLPPAQFAPVLASYEATGFGYGDYSLEPNGLTGNYGITLSSPSWIVKMLEPDETIRILGFIEQGWDNHQDALILQKRPLSA